MIYVGIFNGYFPYDLKTSIEKIKAQGFSTVQLDLAFKDMDFAPGTVTKAKCHTVRDAFRRANLPIACLSGYTNIVHPDREERRRRVGALKEIIRHARDLGTPYVISETGTFNSESDWVHHPRNKTAEGYQEALDEIAGLAQEAYDHGAVFLVENYVNNVVGSVDEVLRLFADLPHPGLGLLMDPTNYFDDANIDHVDATLDRIFDALGERIRIAHAKDCKKAANQAEKHAALDASEAHTFRGAGGVDLPAPGLGSLNYEHYLRRLARLHPNIALIIEHLEESDVPRAKAFVDGALLAVGA
ncbi:xylose isomerase [Rhodospirillum rubrum]|uniref:sugar phosphate isomerase/epimerase family protein n=1 Tax=Rhodospirillum rubrum TaxID=1085 RepID=UPI001907D6E3|nr:sugar phosphate isomerase/epimerase [Rhodospirillum rubrum]MBK1664306.1 xylose isomerase [Rhodospirillum rubrum]MBK1677382.1 xylose isomerase [Rhodospirillum rubrum]